MTNQSNNNESFCHTLKSSSLVKTPTDLTVSISSRFGAKATCFNQLAGLVSDDGRIYYELELKIIHMRLLFLLICRGSFFVQLTGRFIVSTSLCGIFNAMPLNGNTSQVSFEHTVLLSP